MQAHGPFVISLPGITDKEKRLSRQPAFDFMIPASTGSTSSGLRAGGKPIMHRPAAALESCNYQVDEFWTSRQRQADRIHEVSYRACFKPQLPAYFIERYTAPGDVVYDPFMGRGTTPIEAALRGRVPYGNDISPLSLVLTEPRINPPTLPEVAARLDEIDWSAVPPSESAELHVFYHPATLAMLESLRLHMRGRPLDRADAWIRMVAVNRLAGHSRGFFSVRTMPPNQAVSLERQRLLNKRSGLTPEPKDVPALILKKSRSLLSQGIPRAARWLFTTSESHRTPQVRDGEVALTVTSPPFLDVVDYAGDNWLRNWFLGIEEPAFSIHRSVDAWRGFVRDTLRELARVTMPGGRIAFEVGEVRKGSVALDEVVVEAAAGLPLSVESVLVNQQEFTKTANCWGVSNNQRGTNTNRIVLFKAAGGVDRGG